MILIVFGAKLHIKFELSILKLNYFFKCLFFSVFVIVFLSEYLLDVVVVEIVPIVGTPEVKFRLYVDV